jgi:hypothetical protein
VLTGVVVAMAWLLLPLHVAEPVSLVVVIGAMLAQIGQVVWLRRT